jgi:hypothetical protein
MDKEIKMSVNETNIDEHNLANEEVILSDAEIARGARKCRHCSEVVYQGLGGRWYNDERDGRDSQSYCAASAKRESRYHEPIDI